MNRTHRRRPAGSRGFTLVEVLLAVSLIATVAIPIVAFLPVGMDQMKQAVDEGMEVEIVRRLGAALSMSDWEETRNLADWGEKEFHFDSEGTEIDEASDAVYTAKIEFTETGGGSAGANPFLKRVIIRVTNVPAGGGDSFNDRRSHRAHALLISRMDR